MTLLEPIFIFIRVALIALCTAADKLGEKYTKNLEDIQDPLLESWTVLELNCGLARTCLKHSRTTFNRLFRHFFPMAILPDKFEPLVKAFSGKEDPINGYRRLAVKVGVESTIALVVGSSVVINWSAVVAKRYSKEAMNGFLKEAKKYSKGILSTVLPSPAPSTSTTHTEVQ